MTELNLTKTQAANLFGGKFVNLAEALGITRQSLNGWPEELNDRRSNEVIGAALRHGRIRHRNDLTTIGETAQ